MKKQLILALAFLLMSLAGFSQNRTFKLKLTGIKTEFNSKTTSLDDFSTDLTPKVEQVIKVHEQDGYEYRVTAKMLIKGNRLKLTMRNSVWKGGKKVKDGVYKKYMHQLKTGIAGKVDGNGNESIIIDAKSLLAYKVIYKYELDYSK